jgi:hypothetical protein
LKGGEGAEGGERPAAALLLGNRGEVGRLEEEEGADRWAPPVGDRVRESEGSGALGHVGRSSAGRGGEEGREELGRGGGGRWSGLDRFSFFLFFQNLF